MLKDSYSSDSVNSIVASSLCLFVFFPRSFVFDRLWVVVLYQSLKWIYQLFSMVNINIFRSTLLDSAVPYEHSSKKTWGMPCSTGPQICRRQKSTSKTLQCHHFEHLIPDDSHPENITLWTSHTEDSAMCGDCVLCLYKALSGTFMCRWGFRLLACSLRKVLSGIPIF